MHTGSDGHSVRHGPPDRQSESQRPVGDQHVRRMDETDSDDADRWNVFTDGVVEHDGRCNGNGQDERRLAERACGNHRRHERAK